MSCLVKNLSDDEKDELLALLEQEERERVSPKLEQLKDNNFDVAIIRGGRGAGAKSHGTASLLLQKLHYEKHRLVCLREIQNSIDESVYQLLIDKINQLNYRGWEITKNSLVSPAGSKIIFRGLKDLRASQSAKGLEGYDYVWFEEAATITEQSFALVMPTIVRNEGYKVFITYNPETDEDPCTRRFWNDPDPRVIKIQMNPGKEDNPWWGEGLQKEMEKDFERDPIFAEHVWYGIPKPQGDYTVLSRREVNKAAERTIEDETRNIFSIGCDVARFGADKTTIYKRHGMKIIKKKKLSKRDTQEIARVIWFDFARQDAAIPIKIDDTGVGGGVTDKLKDFGANVVPITFNGRPADKKLYTTVADEMWFTFPVDQADIPDDPILKEELSTRKYKYTNDDRRKIETKEEFKKRLGRSPDDADGLLLCYYEGKTRDIMSDETRAAMRKRNAR